MDIVSGLTQANSVSLHPISAGNALAGTKTTAVNTDSFDNFLQAALDIFNETNRYQNEADQIQQDFATGKIDNMLSVMMAQEKAFSSLNFTVQVANKLVQAYQEIMRIQL